MGKDKVIYWIATGIVSAMMLFSAFSYFTMKEMREAFVHLGFPDYFRIQLGITKAIGAIVLLLPPIPYRLKEFAYMGFTIAFISAFIAHLSVGDPVSVMLKAVILLVLLIFSYFYFHKIRKTQNS